MFYNQNDYPNLPYVWKNDGATVASSGCGLCACCMVVEALTAQRFTPAEAAELALSCGARDDTGTEISILAAAVARRFGLRYELTNDAGRLLQFLQDGRGLAVANSGGDRPGWTGVFTTGGHFIVLAAANGREITVWDPSITPTKYDREGRRDKVRVEGGSVYADIAVIARDCDHRTPSYVLFSKN